MRWLGRHLLAVLIVATVAATIGGVFAFARPAYRPHVDAPKNVPLPYTKVSFDASQTQAAFVREGIALTVRHQGAEGTTFGNHRDVLEIDVFPAAARLEKLGFQDLVLSANCTGSARLAERWRGNVRVIVNCAIAEHGQRWVRRVQRALDHLS